MLLLSERFNCKTNKIDIGKIEYNHYYQKIRVSV